MVAVLAVVILNSVKVLTAMFPNGTTHSRQYTVYWMAEAVAWWWWRR